MTKIPGFYITVSPTALDDSAPPAPSPLTFVSFSDRFETDGQWLLGRQILGSIVRHMRDKSVVTCIDPGNPSRLNVSLPEFPKVRNEIDGEMVSIWWTIPEVLRGVVETCCWEALEYRRNDLEAMAPQILYAPSTEQLRQKADHILSSYERNRRAKNDPSDPELWQILAARFGLNWLALPPEPFA